MKRKELMARAITMLDQGIRKREVFTTLTAEGGKPKIVALAIASHLDPRRRAANKGHRIALIAISSIQLIVGLLIVLAVGLHLPPIFNLIGLTLVLLIGGLFVWGFATDKARIYTAYIWLGLVESVRSLPSVGSHPATVLIGVAIALALVAYVYFVRSKLFPDFSFPHTKKVNGEYVFVEEAP